MGDNMRFKIERSEDHHFTIKTQTSQEVEFFHSLIFTFLIELAKMLNLYPLFRGNRQNFFSKKDILINNVYWTLILLSKLSKNVFFSQYGSLLGDMMSHHLIRIKPGFIIT